MKSSEHREPRFTGQRYSEKDIDGLLRVFAWLTAAKEAKDLIARLMRGAKPL